MKREIHFKKRIHFVLIALQQRCKHEYNYDLNIVRRILYTAKIVICIILNRNGSLWGKDNICVAQENCVGNSEDCWWDELVVSPSGWYYDNYLNFN